MRRRSDIVYCIHCNEPLYPTGLPDGSSFCNNGKCPGSTGKPLPRSLLGQPMRSESGKARRRAFKGIR